LCVGGIDSGRADLAAAMRGWTFHRSKVAATLGTMLMQHGLLVLDHVLDPKIDKWLLVYSESIMGFVVIFSALLGFCLTWITEDISDGLKLLLQLLKFLSKH